jgi:hypothetical protein
MPRTVPALAALLALPALLAALVGPAARAAPDAGAARGFEVLAHVRTGEAYTGDVFAHHGHAYLSSYRTKEGCRAHGVKVYDLSDPRAPRLVSRFADARSTPALAGTWTEKTIVRRVATPAFTGDLAATSVQSCRPGAFQGFALYDVTRPAAPRRLALVRTGPRGSHELWLQPRGGRAYVYTAIVESELRSSPDYARAGRAARVPGRPDFRIFDVSVPTRPREVGSWGAWRQRGVHPAAGRGDGRYSANLVHSVIGNAAGTRAFLSYWDYGTVILNVSDPARPRFVGRTAFAGAEPGNAHSAALGNGERLLIQTNEADGVAGHPILFDVSTARAPRRLSALRLPEGLLAQGRRERLLTVGGLDLADSVHDVRIQGTTAFFSWYRQGVVAADVSDPRRPRVLARFLPPAERDPERLLCPDSACTAVWGVAVADDYLLASDLIGGLWVLRFR